jgi:hypothetical protein
MPAPGPLAVDADLTLTAGQDTVRVVGKGDRLIVEAPSVRAVLRLRRLFGSPAGFPVPFGAVFGATGLRVEVRVRGRTVARIDPELRSGSLFRSGPMRIHPVRLLWSWLTDGRDAHRAGG